MRGRSLPQLVQAPVQQEVWPLRPLPLLLLPPRNHRTEAEQRSLRPIQRTTSSCSRLHPLSSNDQRSFSCHKEALLAGQEEQLQGSQLQPQRQQRLGSPASVALTHSAASQLSAMSTLHN